MGQYVDTVRRDRNIGGMIALFTGVALLVVAVGGAGILGYRLVTGSLYVNEDYTSHRAFDVGAAPRLMLKATGDDVSVRAGEAGRISVASDRRVRGFLLNAAPTGTAITSSRQGDAISLDVATPEVAAAGVTSSRVTITVPPRTALDVTSTRGDVAVESVRGMIAISSRSGDVALRGVGLQGQSSVTSASGDVSFSGTLDAAGSYRFQTSSGDVRVALPSSASFALGVPAASEVHNAFGADQVGPAPRPPLLISTGSGDVAITLQG